MQEPSEQNPSMWSALARAIDAGQRLAADRFDLARLEAREDIATLLKGAVVLFVAAPVGLLGWFVLMAAVVIALSPVVAIWVSLAVLGLLHLGLGAGAAWYGLGRIGTQAAAPTQVEGQRLPARMNGGASRG